MLEWGLSQNTPTSGFCVIIKQKTGSRKKQDPAGEPAELQWGFSSSAVQGVLRAALSARTFFTVAASTEAESFDQF